MAITGTVPELRRDYRTLALHQIAEISKPVSGWMSAFGGNVLQNSANERSTSKSGQYQNLKWRFRESKLPIRDLI
jgi:hypothetical protein